MIKLLIFWDIFWRNWRRLVNKYLPELKNKYNPDFILWNSENITSWKWPVLKHILEMKELWFDCLTWWDHTFSNLKDIKDYINEKDSIQIRPLNYYESRFYKVPWKWFRVIEKDWKKLLVINLIGSAFIWGQSFNPFIKVDEILNEFQNEKFDGIIVDFHRETTAEIYAMSEFLNGRISMIFWTHTHVQTNDEHILSNWTGMITDVWMIWSFHSSIGQTFETRLPQFISGLNIFWERPEQDLWLWCINWIFVEIEDFKCVKLDKIKIIEEEK
ncbi:MAG: Metallophosphoesterase [uncultured bacterium (gcode 4)]|uniref:Metallophosphoesterase n=1 Tax=uncultured bacterium (gcode 4) TaxID=1234023 RepID=K2F4G1_9BACT|nr:MAG: Metallophosphoesterase [uncultured bacterium (gcode 4)]